jgi:hypothetical protein
LLDNKYINKGEQIMQNVELKNIVNNLKSYTNGEEFESSSIEGFLSGSTKDGECYIAVSWGRNTYYWYEMEQGDISTMENAIRNQSSMGSLAQAIKSGSSVANTETISLSDIKTALETTCNATQAIKSESHVSLEGLFANWLSSANTAQSAVF